MTSVLNPLSHSTGDASIKYTFAWDRRNAYRQKVYGIVNALVSVGYEYRECREIFWETKTTTLAGYDMTSSEIGGWNLHMHHKYHFQEGERCSRAGGQKGPVAGSDFVTMNI